MTKTSNIIGTLLFQIFLLISAITFIFFLLPYFFHFQDKLALHTLWLVIAIVSYFLSFLSKIILCRQKASISMDEEKIVSLQKQISRMNSTLLQMIQIHLKVSILFWIHFYKKEKVRSLDETKKVIFRNLKKEFSDVPGMENMLLEIYKQLMRKSFS